MLLLFFCFTMSSGYAQQHSNFEIKFYKSKGSLSLACNNCSWTYLTARKNAFHLNQLGMVNIKNDLEAYTNSDFIVSVERKKNKIILTGKKGTSWESLSFNLSSDKNLPTVVDESGFVLNN